MSPEQKAEELVDKMLYCYQDHIDKYTAKQCALIAVDEIISINISTPTDYGASWTYWNQVKREIEKL